MLRYAGSSLIQLMFIVLVCILLACLIYSRVFCSLVFFAVLDRLIAGGKEALPQSLGVEQAVPSGCV